ncbi:MAG: sugar phosphate isomerase/epimerase family protein [Armatimonadota bacterium]|nr:sugar phosphate isomerase/epimerase family protein [Armatimonadota bacterium]MDR7463408.1 sugar phosphate isomerase/epimerase family protein [Armatimonadota bacterium]MDR7475573.1 sugar phosphate isomerase/epimerase family protein [Armatimonadota bacterium]MDR7539759.1 sugar phosphate isomerase/epimerase family protein [Armatimonadota bacterium]
MVSLYLSAPGSRFWAAASGLALEDALARTAALGFGAVELMPRDVEDPTPEALRDAAQRCGLQVLGLATGFIALERGLTLTHPDHDVRRQAVRAVQACLRSAQRAGARFVSLGLVRGKLPAGASPQQAREHLVAATRECGMTAGELGLLLLVEPGNRYETDFIHTVEEGVALLQEVDLPSVRLQADTFHMNIEEASLPDALRQGSAHLAHLHLADSNRRAPGWGHLDFPAVAAALREIGYDGAVGVEILLEPDFETAARQALGFVRQLFRPQSG